MNLKQKDENNDFSFGNEGIRLHVYLAQSGVASRRASEKLIAEGRITVNGAIVSTPGEKVLAQDEVCFDGKLVKREKSLHYLVLNKPPLYICSAFDPQGRPRAQELLPPCKERLYNIGRLDYLSSGLILFTNDGEFAVQIGHPRAKIEKEYLIDSTVVIPDTVIEDFSRGLVIDETLYRAHKIERTGRKSLRIVLIEGKNREIRKVFSHFHLHPKRLQRVRIGPVEIGSLNEGESRPLTEGELNILRSKIW